MPLLLPWAARGLRIRGTGDTLRGGGVESTTALSPFSARTMESQGGKDNAEGRKANRDAASRYRQRKRDREHSVEVAVAQVFNENSVLREANRRLRATLPPLLLLSDSLLLQLEQRGLVSLFASGMVNSSAGGAGGSGGGSGSGGFGGTFDSSGGGPAAAGALAAAYMPGYLPPQSQQQQQQQQQQQHLHLPLFSAGMVGSGGAGGGGFGSSGGGFGGTYNSSSGTAAAGAMVAAYIPPLPPSRASLALFGNALARGGAAKS